MIYIDVQRQAHTLDMIHIRGHAGAGPHGYDLVCAAVSAIATGALNALEELFPNQCDLHLSEDPADIKIRVKQPSEALAQWLEGFIIQLKTVANAHPSHVRIQE